MRLCPPDCPQESNCPWVESATLVQSNNIRSWPVILFSAHALRWVELSDGGHHQNRPAECQQGTSHWKPVSPSIRLSSSDGLSTRLWFNYTYTVGCSHGWLFVSFKQFAVHVRSLSSNAMRGADRLVASTQRSMSNNTSQHDDRRRPTSVSQWTLVCCLQILLLLTKTIRDVMRLPQLIIVAEYIHK